ncbi:MAG: cytochrome P450, partial [Pseudomonadota bacterium]
AGPRVCIGNAFAMMEMVAGIATLLQHVRLRPAANCDDFTFMHLLTLKPSNGLPLDVEFI